MVLRTKRILCDVQIMLERVKKKSRHRCRRCAQSCPTLWDPMDCRSPGSSVHGISQVRIYSGLLFPPPGNLSNPGIKPPSLVSHLLQWLFATATLEACSACLRCQVKDKRKQVEKFNNIIIQSYFLEF